MPISFHKRAGELPADASLGNWPIVLCLGLAWETYRRIKARLGRFEVHVRRGPQDQQAIGLLARPGPTRSSFRSASSRPGKTQPVACVARRPAWGFPSFSSPTDQRAMISNRSGAYDGPESLNEPILLADLSGQLAQYIPLRGRLWH